jgi:pimeloyl-ACP methyl ester carboxylesterase
VNRGEVVVDHAAVTLRYLEAGAGPDLMILPGWSQTAELFTAQVEAFGASHHVVALDHRGHGRSDEPPLGYHVHRLAADVNDALTAMELRDVTLLAHSMGCAVIWAYLELFGPERIMALVFVDQMASVLRNPAWSDEQAESVGATLDVASLFEFTNGLRAGGDDPRVAFLHDVTSDGIDAGLLDHLIAQNLLFDRHHAAGLLFDTASFDWRDQIDRIEVPTLVVAGDSVNVPIRSQHWLHQHIVGSQFARIAPEVGGTHFPFLEQPDEFNEAVAAFLAERANGERGR